MILHECPQQEQQQRYLVTLYDESANDNNWFFNAKLLIAAPQANDSDVNRFLVQFVCVGKSF